VSPEKHALASAGSGLLFYAITGSSTFALLTVASGILLDIDHLPEYLIKNGLRKTVSSFLTDEMHLTDNRTVLLFHGFDLVLVVTLILVKMGYALGALAFGLGAFVHLLLDQAGNPIRTKWAFFLAYRMAKGFKTEYLYFRVSGKAFRKQKRDSSTIEQG